uniref:Secreted protein n=1 Tax=Rhizophora mucronata TaxID=61149 RepID=A0A2P2N061_RHIMU
MPPWRFSGISCSLSLNLMISIASSKLHPDGCSSTQSSKSDDPLAIPKGSSVLEASSCLLKTFSKRLVIFFIKFFPSAIFKDGALELYIPRDDIKGPSDSLTFSLSPFEFRQ